MTRLAAAATTALVALVLAAAPAQAEDPGPWTLASTSTLPLTYYQGVTADDGRGAFFFSGHVGLYRTAAEWSALPGPAGPFLRETARNDDVIPPDVHLREGYNHIGDLDVVGDQVLLPLECYYPGGPNGGNTCPTRAAERGPDGIGTGAIGIADPDTLRWRYYVRLAESDIKKAMWVEVGPGGQHFWTQDGKDLVKYAMRDLSPGNAATKDDDTAIEPVERVENIVPDTGITGATFVDGRLYVAGQKDDPASDKDIMQVHSLDPGAEPGDPERSRLEIERRITGESEGLATLDALDGTLHWQIMPWNEEAPPTYGAANGVLLTFARR